MLPLVEPEFLGLIGHRPGVEHAVMLDDALEPVGPLPLDPVHHIAAVRRPERAGIAAIEPAELAGRRGEPFLQILERPAAPIVADRVGERLAVAGRPMEIDRHHRIARPGEHRGVPAIGPAVVARSLRSAMDDERHRCLRTLGQRRRTHRIAPDLVVVRAGEAEPLDLGQIDPGELCGVDRGQPADLLARESIEIVGRGQAVHAEHQPAFRRHHRRDDAFLRQPSHLAVLGIDREDRLFLRVLRGDVKRLAVRRPGDRGDRAIPALGQRAHLPGGEIAQHQHLTVGLVAGTRHRDIGQRLAVRRHGREIVGPVIVGGEVDRRRRPVGRCREDVEIGRGRLDPPRLAQREIDHLAVGRPAQFLATAERLGRCIAEQLAGDWHTRIHKAVNRHS